MIKRFGAEFYCYLGLFQMGYLTLHQCCCIHFWQIEFRVTEELIALTEPFIT